MRVKKGDFNKDYLKQTIKKTEYRGEKHKSVVMNVNANFAALCIN
jgi:hypothetical protein